MTLKTILPFIVLSLFMILGALASNINLNQGLSAIFINTNAVVLNNSETWNVESLATGDVNAAQIYTYLNDTMTSTEINDAIDSTTMIVVFLKGDYHLDDVIWLKSNKTYIINPGATIAWANGSTPYNFKIHSDVPPIYSGNHTIPLWAEDQENIALINYGLIYPSRIYDPYPNSAKYSTIMMNTTNTFQFAGRVFADRFVWIAGNRGNGIDWSEYSIATNLFKHVVPGVNASVSENGAGFSNECGKYDIYQNMVGDGFEGVDLNSKPRWVILSDIVHHRQYNDGTELIDLDAGSQILAVNIIGSNYDNVATLQGSSGWRIADCTNDYPKRNIHVRATCNGCLNPALMTINATIIMASGDEYLYTNGSIDMKGSNISDVLNFTLSNGTTWK